MSRCEIPWDWNSNKRTAITLLSGVLEENLHQFWDPPVVEEQFVKYVIFYGLFNFSKCIV